MEMIRFASWIQFQLLNRTLQSFTVGTKQKTLFINIHVYNFMSKSVGRCNQFRQTSAQANINVYLIACFTWCVHSIHDMVADKRSRRSHVQFALINTVKKYPEVKRWRIIDCFLKRLKRLNKWIQNCKPCIYKTLLSWVLFDGLAGV